MVAAVTAIAVGCSLITLLAMERRTISSTVPALDDLPGVSPARSATLNSAGIRTPFDIAAADSVMLSQEVGVSLGTASSLVRSAQLATLRGIGTTYLQSLLSLDIRSVCALAKADPEVVWQAIHATTTGFRPPRPEVRVWVLAAGDACEE